MTHRWLISTYTCPPSPSHPSSRLLPHPAQNLPSNILITSQRLNEITRSNECVRKFKRDYRRATVATLILYPCHFCTNLIMILPGKKEFCCLFGVLKLLLKYGVLVDVIIILNFSNCHDCLSFVQFIFGVELIYFIIKPTYTVLTI